MSVRETTPVRRPDMLAPGLAAAETAPEVEDGGAMGGKATGDEERGGNALGWGPEGRIGVNGAEVSGASTTHMLEESSIMVSALPRDSFIPV